MLDRARNGYFRVEELKEILVKSGESLEESEFKEFMKILKVKADGTVNTEGFRILYVFVLLTNLIIFLFNFLDLIKLLSSEFQK